MRIGSREVGRGHPVFIVAEIGTNHAGSLELACQLVHAAAEAGADAVKFQVYEPSCLTVDSDHPAYVMTEGPWKGRRLWDLYAEAQTPWAWIPELAALAGELGLEWFASAFSKRGLAFLEDVAHCPAYKIASAEVTDLELVRAIARTGKPVLLSNGMADPIPAVSEIVQTGGEFLELRCVSKYPADPADYQLRDVRELAPHRACGVSDHTMGNEVAIAAVALGACVVEKHLRLDEYGYCLAGKVNPADFDHSIPPGIFAEYVQAIRATERMMRPEPHTYSGSQWRRRLVFACDLPAGHVIAASDVRTARCAQGFSPEAEVVGGVTRHAVRAGDPVMEIRFELDNDTPPEIGTSETEATCAR